MKCTCNGFPSTLNCPCSNSLGVAKVNAWERNKKIESLIKEKDAKGESYSEDEKKLIFLILKERIIFCIIVI